MKSATRSLFGLIATITLMSSFLCTAQTAPPKRIASQSPNLTHQVQSNYGHLPLAFEANLIEQHVVIRGTKRSHTWAN